VPRILENPQALCKYIDAGETLKQDLLIKLNKADKTYAKELGAAARIADSPDALLSNTGRACGRSTSSCCSPTGRTGPGAPARG